MLAVTPTDFRNPSLGKAISYMLKHWEALTRFLESAGRAPGQQLVRTAVEKIDSAPKKFVILQNRTRCLYRRSVYEPDSYL